MSKLIEFGWTSSIILVLKKTLWNKNVFFYIIMLID